MNDAIAMSPAQKILLQFSLTIILAVIAMQFSQFAEEYWVLTWGLALYIAFSSINFIQISKMHKVLSSNNSNEKPLEEKINALKLFYFYCTAQKDLRSFFKEHTVQENDFIELYLKCDKNGAYTTNHSGKPIDFPQDAFLSLPCLSALWHFRNEGEIEFINFAILCKTFCKTQETREDGEFLIKEMQKALNTLHKNSQEKP